MRPGDRELVTALGPVRSLVRRPYAYATSWPLEELDVERPDGTHEQMILKLSSWGDLPESARVAKAEAEHDPAREIDTYRRFLDPHGVGPRFHASHVGPDTQWLVVEKVPGSELWQIGDFEVWLAVARWLARFHASFACDAAALHAQHPSLIRYDERACARVAAAAAVRLARSADPRASALRRLLEAHVAAPGDTRQVTLVHGELYPSNVLVGRSSGDVQVWPIDWETAGSGPAAIDLAALVGGWDGSHRMQLVHAYADAAGVDRDPLRHEVDHWRLHLALRWIVRAEAWQPPPEHAHDWVGEALDAARVTR